MSGTLQINLINLDRSTDRLASFQRRNAHLADVVRFPAIDGRALDTERLVNEGIITRDCSYKGGTLGTAMSHISLWRKAVDEQRPITVAEDDAIFSRHFVARAPAVLAKLNTHWDLVKWGWNFDAFVWVDVIPQVVRAKMIFNQKELRRNVDAFQTVETAPAAVAHLHSFGMLCYSVTPRGARELLARCLPLDAKLIDFVGFGVRIHNNSIDCAINRAYPFLKTFLCIPPLAVSENRQEDLTRLKD